MSTRKKRGDGTEERVSVGTQTEMTIHSDLLMSVFALPEWERLLVVCEMLSCLSPLQQTLLSTMLNSILSPQEFLLNSHRQRANSPTSINSAAHNVPLEQARDMLFPVVCVLEEKNRQAAVAWCSLLDRVVREKDGPRTVEELNQLLSCTVAAIHHPAFPVHSKEQLQHTHDKLHNQYEQVKPSQRVSRKGHHPPAIRSLRCEDVTGDGEEQVAIEVTWTDDVVSYANRSRQNLERLHRELLDEFGLVTKDHRHRILPYFPNADAPSALLAKYVNQLSDLPTRFLFHEIFYREFFSSRMDSSSLSSGPPYHSDWQEDYEMVGGERLPMPTGITCSHCAGPHQFEHCTVYYEESKKRNSTG